MQLNIIIPLIVLPIVIIGALVWYRRSMAAMRVDTDHRPPSGVRLTAEALHRLTPPWRVVFEISGNTLGGVDHVVIGPAGVVAISTLIGDRPRLPADSADSADIAHIVAEAAIARGDVDDLTRRVGTPCHLHARVYWGSPDPARPASESRAQGSVAIEGQRLVEALTSGLPVPPAAPEDGPLDPSRIDLAWRTIVTGIGRPDPLA